VLGLAVAVTLLAAGPPVPAPAVAGAPGAEATTAEVTITGVRQTWWVERDGTWNVVLDVAGAPPGATVAATISPRFQALDDLHRSYFGVIEGEPLATIPGVDLDGVAADDDGVREVSLAVTLRSDAGSRPGWAFLSAGLRAGVYPVVVTVRDADGTALAAVAGVDGEPLQVAPVTGAADDRVADDRVGSEDAEAGRRGGPERIAQADAVEAPEGFEGAGVDRERRRVVGAPRAADAERHLRGRRQVAQVVAEQVEPVVHGEPGRRERGLLAGGQGAGDQSGHPGVVGGGDQPQDLGGIRGATAGSGGDERDVVALAPGGDAQGPGADRGEGRAAGGPSGNAGQRGNIGGVHSVGQPR